MYFRQFFLKSMYFSSFKIPENQESASLTVLSEGTPYTGYTMTLCMQKVFIAKYICLCDNSHIRVSDPRRTLFDSGEQRKISNLQLELYIVSAMKLNYSLLYDDNTPTHAANDTKRTFLIVWSKILDGRSWSYFDIELCTVSTLKRYNHHNQIDDTSFIAAMTFGRSTLILGSKYDQ